MSSPVTCRATPSTQSAVKKKISLGLEPHLLLWYCSSREKKKWSGEGGGDLSDKTMKRNDDYSKIGNLKVMECHRRPVRPFKTYKD